MGEIAWPDLWEDYTEEIDQAIQHIFRGDDPVFPFDGAKVYRTSNLTIPDSVFTHVTMQASSFDTGNYWINGNRFDIPKDGYYEIRFQARFAAAVAGSTFVTYRWVRGATIDVFMPIAEKFRVQDTETIVCGMKHNFITGDLLYFDVFQSGVVAGLTLMSGVQNSFAEIQFLGT